MSVGVSHSWTFDPGPSDLNDLKGTGPIVAKFHIVSSGGGNGNLSIPSKSRDQYGNHAHICLNI